jgi:hypothetical protein
MVPVRLSDPGLFEFRNDWRAAGDNQVRCGTSQFRCECPDAAKVAAGKPMFDLNVAVLHPSERRKSLPKRRDPGTSFRIILGDCV